MTGDRTTAKSSGGYNFSAKFKQGPFEVLRCDPVTGELLGLPGVSLLVCPPHETPYALDCRESDNGGWHWPEREGDSA